MSLDDVETAIDIVKAYDDATRVKSTGEKVWGFIKFVLALAICVIFYLVIQYAPACQESGMIYDPNYGHVSGE